MAKIKVAVVANCQARPIAFLLENAIPDVEIVTIAIVHLLKNGQENEYVCYFDDADYIVTQKIAETYPCEFIRTINLRKRYSHKIIEIPNLYFRGYNPELRYYRISGQGTLTGPLGDYHNEIVFDCWKQGYDLHKTLEVLNDESEWNRRFNLVAKQSIEQLSNRERDLDISVSDFIRDNVSEKRLFYTFNHPCLEMLLEVVKKLSILLSRKFNSSFSIESIQEPLNQFYTPLNKHAARFIDFKLDNDSVSDCRWLRRDANGRYSIRSHFTLIELIEEFFRSYDADKLTIQTHLI